MSWTLSRGPAARSQTVSATQSWPGTTTFATKFPATSATGPPVASAAQKCNRRGPKPHGAFWRGGASWHGQPGACRVGRGTAARAIARRPARVPHGVARAPVVARRRRRRRFAFAASIAPECRQTAKVPCAPPARAPETAVEQRRALGVPPGSPTATRRLRRRRSMRWPRFTASFIPTSATASWQMAASPALDRTRAGGDRDRLRGLLHFLLQHFSRQGPALSWSSSSGWPRMKAPRGH